MKQGRREASYFIVVPAGFSCILRRWYAVCTREIRELCAGEEVQHERTNFVGFVAVDGMGGVRPEVQLGVGDGGVDLVRVDDGDDIVRLAVQDQDRAADLVQAGGDDLAARVED